MLAPEIQQFFYCLDACVRAALLPRGGRNIWIALVLQRSDMPTYVDRRHGWKAAVFVVVLPLFAATELGDFPPIAGHFDASVADHLRAVCHRLTFSLLLTLPVPSSAVFFFVLERVAIRLWLAADQFTCPYIQAYLSTSHSQAFYLARADGAVCCAMVEFLNR